MNVFYSERLKARLLPAKEHHAIVARVMEGWRAKKDTADIAKEIGETEAIVSVALRIGREQERA